MFAKKKKCCFASFLFWCEHFNINMETRSFPCLNNLAVEAVLKLSVGVSQESGFMLLVLS